MFRLSIAALAFLLGWGGFSAKISAAGKIRAIAFLRAQDGSQVSGKVEFEEVKGGVRFRIRAVGLPNGRHALHIYASGDCASPGPANAHFNPDGLPHGSPDFSNEKRHPGDLGNVVAAAGIGDAEFERIVHGLTISGGPGAIIGRTIMVKTGPDDFTTLPDGGAGPALACGKIELAGKNDVAQSPPGSHARSSLR